MIDGYCRGDFRLCALGIKLIDRGGGGGPRRFIQPKREQATDLIESWGGPWTSQKCIVAGSHRWPSCQNHNV